MSRTSLDSHDAPARRSGSPVVDDIRVSAYVIPTDAPESDGTAEWDHTTLVLVETLSAGRTGIGWTYADRATAEVVRDPLAAVVRGKSLFAVPEMHAAMGRAVRNLGRPGIAAMAIAAVEASAYDAAAKAVGVPLFRLLGACRSAVSAYGSGGFTSYTDERLREQLGGWFAQGFTRVKMKVGREPGRDVARARAAREVIGDAELFVDANGAYGRKEALDLALPFRELGVSWFEEPVSSDDLEGLHLLRDRGPAGMDIAAGEYGYELPYFRRMLQSGAVDVLQADATRCGVLGFLRADALCEGFGLRLSAHCAPTLHAHLGCAAQRLVHVEYFHDHARIEQMLFDGAVVADRGMLRPDPTRPGLGVEFKEADARRFRV